ncbi:MAG: radical SAM protein [Candidatus Omnitrophica bacterium]|nr:radical SAM protein [Candidatus Omnitrophota bacterium]
MRVGLFIFPVRFSNLPPIDIAYLSAYLKKRGHEVYLHDFNVEIPVSDDCDTDIWCDLGNQERLFNKNKHIVEAWVQQILDFAPDVVGFSVWHSQLYFSLQIAQMVKARNKDIKVVFGGPWCSYMGSSLSYVIGDGVDYIVYGEGEATLSEIVESENSKRAIAGCFRRIDGEIVDGGWREEIGDLDLLPFPDYAHFDFNKYLLSAYPILLGRGCTWNCSFCTRRSVWRNFRYRSPENIFEEMRHCFSRYPFMKKFQSCDHAMNANMPQLLRLCDLIIGENIHIEEFSGFGQVNPLMLQEEVMLKLKRAGFNSWGIGVQSGSDRILKSMKRPYTAAQAERMLEVMYRAGVLVTIDFIIGYPEETEEDFKLTSEFTARVGKYVTNISVCPHCFVGGNDLALHPERYGIYALNKAQDTWESAANTPAIRRRRYQCLMKQLAVQGVAHQHANADRDKILKEEQRMG